MGFICLASVAQPSTDSFVTRQNHAGLSSPIFLHFSYTIKDFNKVVLQWVIDSIGENDYFVVERGKDSSNFETVGVLKRMAATLQYDITDNKPSSGINYYRIKCTDSIGQIYYSNILQVRLVGNEGFKFYPNPVDKLLIVEISHAADLQIVNSAGAIVVNRQLQGGMQVINVSSLEKGEYVLRIADKENNRVVLEHLLKN